MIQLIIIGFLFALALGFIGRRAVKAFSAKSDCSKGCADCGSSTESAQ